MNASPDIQLVVFDLGGVMIRLAPDPILLELGQRPELVALNAQHEIGQLNDDAFVQAIADAAGMSAQAVSDIHYHWIVEPYTGVAEVVDAVVAATGVQTACLSNTNARHWHRMLDPGHPTSLPLPKLDYRFASHLVGMRKPNEEIYQHVEQVTGFAGEQIVFFDDNAANIAMANQSGWHGVQINPSDDPPSQMRQWLQRAGVV